MTTTDLPQRWLQSDRVLKTDLNFAQSINKSDAIYELDLSGHAKTMQDADLIARIKSSGIPVAITTEEFAQASALKVYYDKETQHLYATKYALTGILQGKECGAFAVSKAGMSPSFETKF